MRGRGAGRVASLVFLLLVISLLSLLDYTTSSAGASPASALPALRKASLHHRGGGFFGKTAPTTTTVVQAPPPPLAPAPPKPDASVMTRIKSRKGSWGTRVASTLALLGLTAAITYVGQRKGLELIVIGAQAGAYNEVAKLLDKGLDLPSSLASRWLWFILAFNTGHSWAYGDTLMPSLLPSWLHWYWPGRRLVQYLAYVCLLGGAITPKGPGEQLQRQVAHLAGLHFTLFLTVGLGSGYVAILKQWGVRPFLLSVLLVVVNDIGAYLVGVPLGKTPLTKLSPKKSWEGFWGAAGLTVLSAPLIVRLLKAVLGSIPEDSQRAIGGWLSLSDWQALVLASFASFGAPLGGILASAAKRATGTKDFGDSIPGHGGVMDRVDCQLFMSAFSYLFLSCGVKDGSGGGGR